MNDEHDDGQVGHFGSPDTIAAERRLELELADALEPDEPEPEDVVASCPGERACFSRGGTLRCRVHGCRVCGGVILADTEDWPAPLCPAHSPELVFDYVDALRALVVRHLEAFDRLHSPDCRVWLMHPNPPPPDDELDVEPGRQGPCSCGATALRQDARELLGIRNRYGARRRPSPENPS